MNAEALQLVTVPAVPTDVSGADSDERLVDLFLHARGLSRLTIQTYQFELARFQSMVPVPLRAVTLADLQDRFIGPLSEKGLSRTTLSRALTVLRSLFKFGVETGYLRFNPAIALRIKRPTTGSAGTSLTPGEVERMLQSAREKGSISFAVAACLLGLGLRRAELHDACWGDIYDDGAGRIGIRVVGKGNKLRRVKVRDDLWRFLRGWRRRRGLSDALDPSDRSPLVISRDENRLSIRAIHDRVVAVARAAGINKRVSPHTCRHTYATLSLQNGASVVMVRDALGHSSLSTTSVYLHAARGLEDAAADHLPFRIGGDDG